MRRIALITDFGWSDPYVAAVKGVIASRCDAPVSDLTHDIPPFDTFAAAWFLRATWSWWPEETIFVCVIDPGVGTARRILAAERDGRLFLAPDNGVLSFVEPNVAVAVTDESLYLAGTSTTFHGRDRFAPLAAALANGRGVTSLGVPAGALVRIDYVLPSYREDGAVGTIVHIDRFGNAVTDIERARLPPGRIQLTVSGVVIDRLQTSYTAGDNPRAPFLIVGSTGHVEISLASGNAAAVLHLRRGDRVTISLR